MTTLYTFLLASLLAALDLGILAWATRALSAKLSTPKAILLFVLVALKLALLVLGCAWLVRQPWADRKALVAGLLTPFLFFLAWQALRLQVRAGKRV